MTKILPEMMNLYVIVSDPGTITTIQGVGIALRDPGLFQGVEVLVKAQEAHYAYIHTTRLLSLSLVHFLSSSSP